MPPPRPASNRSRLRTLIPLGAVVALLSTPGAMAVDRVLDVSQRVWAGQGDPNRKLWEPAIAAGEDLVITVYTSGINGGVRYAVYDTATADWVDEDAIPSGDCSQAHDASIAYNSITGEFVAAAAAGKQCGGVTCKCVVTSVFHPESGQNYPGHFDTWGEVATYSSGYEIDKPWIVAGEMSEAIQEFYMVWYKDSDVYQYLRSIDGGECWAQGDTGFARIFCAQPAVWNDGALYVAYVTGAGNIGFYVGEDVDPNDPNNYDCSDANDVGVTFTVMRGYREAEEEGMDDPITPPLTIPVNRVIFSHDLPGELRAQTVPQLAVDPSLDPNDPNEPDVRLFLVYHDTASDDPNDPGYHDVNAYLYKIEGWGSCWVASPRVKVNDDTDPDGEYDQFMPSVTVDGEGWIHVLFYDDRRFDQEDGAPDPNNPPRFDGYYAWATVDNLTFQDRNVILYLDPNDPGGPSDPPGLNWEDEDQLDPHEYNGIAWYADTVWTTYTGTDPNDPQANDSVVWSSRLDWIWE